MKKLLTFLTLLTLFFTTTWATTVTVSIQDYAYTHNWENSTKYSTVVLDANITASASSGTNTGKYYTNGQNWRFYKSETGTLTISAADGYTIQTITLNFTKGKEASKLSYLDNDVTSGTAVTVNKSSASFVAGGDSYIGITSISVTYDVEGTDPPTPEAYSITGTGTQTGGSVTASATSNITEGTSIIITATPNTGYELSNLTVDGNDVTSNVNTNYQYTFSMPAHDVVVSATFTEQSTPQPSGSNIFERINSTSQLEAGKRYLLVYKEEGKTPAVMGAISTGSTKYGISVTGDNNFTLTNGVLTLTDNTIAEILTLGGDGSAWTFQFSDNKYLSWTSGNSLNSANSVDQNSQWIIQFESDNVKISNLYSINNQGSSGGVRYIKYNSSSPRFACYTSGQQAIELYKEVENIVEAEDLYVVGQVNGNDEDPFDTNEGVQLTYSQTNDNYSGDFYCTGMNAGYSYFLFSKKVPYSFSNASDLYGSGATNSYWAISEDGTNESHFGDVIPLYAGWTNSFRLPAGLYTVTVDLSDVPNLNDTDKSIVVTKRDVTMTISPSYAYFEDTQTVTMASNLTDIGGKIYYTTDGGNPSDPNSSRQEYTGPITINATTTFKAVAFVGNLYSAVVDKTFTKTPKTPVITPNGGTITEATEVTITCETEGASIYYTLDGTTTPTNVVSETNFLYSGPFTISETTTVKARAYVGNTYSNGIATAEFVYTEPIVPGTGDFIRVTSEDDLVAGREYIIVAEGYTYAMGAVTSNKKASATTNFEISTDHSTVTAGDAVNILKLGDGQVYDNNDNKYWTLTQQDGKKFLLGQTSTDIQAQTYIASGCTDEFIINIANTTSGNNEIKYAIVSGGGGRQIWFNGEVFGHYANSTASSYSHVFLYYRDAVISKSLKQIESTGEHGGVVGTKYAIADDYLVAVESRDVAVDGDQSQSYVYVWCKDNNNVANPISVADGVIDFMRQGNNAPQQGEWDQSNWIVLRFKGDDQDARSLKNHMIKDIVGTYIDATNYMIDVESYDDGGALTIPYKPNVYCVANFNPAYIANGGIATQPNDENQYFFMPPKAQEVCEIRYAEWDGTNKTFTVPEASGFEGTLSLDWTYNQNAAGTPLTQQQAESAIESSNVPDPENGKLPTYKFLAVVQNNPSKGAVSGANKVYPMNLEGNTSNIITAISVVNANGQVKSVKYVNVAGMVSDVPFQGVNIVVTEYTDGSRTTSKMLRK